MLRFITLFSSVFISSSFACIGGGKVDISFKRDTQGNVILSLKAGRGEGEGDFGRHGIHQHEHGGRAPGQVGAEAKANGQVDGGKFKAVISFLKTRAAVFKKTVMTAGLPAPAATKLGAALDGVVGVTEKSTFEGSELELKLNALTNAMYETKLNVTAAVREAGVSAWQPEQVYRQLGLPEAGLTRSLGGCNSVTAFNPNIGAMPTASAEDADQMPSFSVK